jgi:homoserine trans-succinylase
MIATLGNLKDNGLRILALHEAMNSDVKLAKLDIGNLLPAKHPTLDMLLKEASAILKQFFKEDVLGKLVV